MRLRDSVPDVRATHEPGTDPSVPGLFLADYWKEPLLSVTQRQGDGKTFQQGNLLPLTRDATRYHSNTWRLSQIEPAATIGQALVLPPSTGASSCTGS